MFKKVIDTAKSCVRFCATGAKKFVVAAAGAATIATASVQNAHAVLPTEAATAITDVNTFITDIIAGVWPLAAAVAVGALGFKLFKKFTGKAT